MSKLNDPAAGMRPKRKPGLWRGRVWMHPDFAKPDAELESLFYDGPIEPAPFAGDEPR